MVQGGKDWDKTGIHEFGTSVVSAILHYTELVMLSHPSTLN